MDSALTVKKWKHEQNKKQGKTATSHSSQLKNMLSQHISTITH